MMTLLKTFYFFENINRITLMWTGGPMQFQVNSVSTTTNEVYHYYFFPGT